MALAVWGAQRRCSGVHPVLDARGPPRCPPLWAAPTYTSSFPVSRRRWCTRLRVAHPDCSTSVDLPGAPLSAARLDGGTSVDLPSALLLPHVLTPPRYLCWRRLPATHLVCGAHVAASVSPPVGAALLIGPVFLFAGHGGTADTLTAGRGGVGPRRRRTARRWLWSVWYVGVCEFLSVVWMLTEVR